MRYGNRDRFSGHTGGEICHVKRLNYLYLTIMWWERTQFSNSTFWRLVFSHSWFRIHLQLDFVSLEMNSEPLVWEHQSPKCFGGEPTILCVKNIPTFGPLYSTLMALFPGYGISIGSRLPLSVHQTMIWSVVTLSLIRSGKSSFSLPKLMGVYVQALIWLGPSTRGDINGTPMLWRTAGSVR